MNNQTIREQLLTLGMKETELANHSSDLYMLKNEISTNFVKTYEFKCNVTTFIDNIDHLTWYEIPFAYTEHYKETVKDMDEAIDKIKNKTVRKISNYERLRKDLLSYLTKEEITRCVNNLKSQVANREKEIMLNYDSIALEGTNIINVYGKDTNGFSIDIRKETLGNICN